MNGLRRSLLGVGMGGLVATSAPAQPNASGATGEAVGPSPGGASAASTVAAASPASAVQPVPATGEPSAPPVSDSLPVLGAERPTTVIEQLEYCFSLPASANAAACFVRAAELTHFGLEVQRCLWGLPSSVTCSAAKPFETPADDVMRDELLKRGAELEAYLRNRAPRERRDVVLLKLQNARRTISRLIAKDRARSTLVSQGGVSLGSWQAGFLYLTTEWEKDRVLARYKRQLAEGSTLDAPRAAYATITGASAGAVNGLATALESCLWQAPRRPPEESLYFRVWVESLGLFGRSGLPGLFPTSKTPSESLGLFNRGGALKVSLDLAEQYAKKHGPTALQGCSVDLGFATTHLEGVQTPVFTDNNGEPIVSRASLREKFALRLTFQPKCGDGLAEAGMCIENIEPPQLGYLVPRQDGFSYAGLGRERQVPLTTMLRAVQASGAFPVAFPPVDLDYMTRTRGKDGTQTLTPKRATFVDGGTLDNTPVGLAAAMNDWRNEQSSNPYLRDVLTAEPLTYIFVDPGVISWTPTPEVEKTEDKDKGVVEALLGFVGDFFASSLDSEFLDNARALPFMREYKDHWVGPRLAVPKRHLPIAGQFFGHFMAFLEKDFRQYDFYAGMADAYEYLKHEECLLHDLTDSGACEKQGGALPLVSALDKRQRATNPFYDCLRAYYDDPRYGAKSSDPAARLLSQADLPKQCQDTFLSAHTAGLIDSDDWEPLDQLVVDVERERAVNAADEATLTRYNFRALLVGLHNFKVWTQAVDYTADAELEHLFSELTHAPATACVKAEDCLETGFAFVDLVGWLRRTYNRETFTMRLDAETATAAFRKLAQQGLTQFTEPQSTTSKVVLGLVGRPAADGFLMRTYPDQILGIDYINDGFEVYGGTSLWEPGIAQLRLDLGARIFRLGRRRIEGDLNPFTVSVAAFGRLALVVPIVPVWFDAELAGGITAEQVWAPTAPRHRPFPGNLAAPLGSLSATILQRINVGVEYQYRSAALQNVTAPFRDTRLFDKHSFSGWAGFRFLW
jgi:hypothetical protein